MTETRRFIKESAIYTIGEILTKSQAIILIPIYTHFLSQSDYGIYSLVITIWPILVILFGKGFGGYIIRGYYNGEEESKRKNFFGSLILLSVLFSIALALLIHLFGNNIFSLLFKGISYKPFLQFAVGIAVFKLFINNVLSIYRAKRKPGLVVVISFITFFITTVLVLILVVGYKKELLGALWGQLLALLIVSLFLFLYIKKDITYRIDSKYIIPSFMFMLPLIPHAIAGWVINLSDRVLIERFCSLEDLAIYSLGYQLAMALEMIINSMNQAWIPFYYSNIENPDNIKELKKSTTFYFTIVVLIGYTLSLFSNEIIAVMGKAQYAQSSIIFPMIILGYIFYSIYFMTTAPILYSKRTYIFPIITVVIGAINIVLNLLYIPRYGFIVAAYTTILSYFLMFFLSYLVSLKFHPIPFQKYKMMIILTLAGLLFIVSLLIQNYNIVLQILIKLILVILYPLLLIFLNIIPFKELKKYVSLLLLKHRVKDGDTNK